MRMWGRTLSLRFAAELRTPLQLRFHGIRTDRNGLHTGIVSQSTQQAHRIPAGRSVTEELFGQNMNEILRQKIPKPHHPNSDHPYKNMFPWRTPDEFYQHLKSTICYNDGKLVCLVKPWGIGTHAIIDKNMTTRNPDAVYNRIIGSPRYCLADMLNFLRADLGIPNLRLIRSLDRYQSGIVMYASDEDTAKNVAKVFRHAIAAKEPSFRYFAVTKGIPMLKSLMDREHLALQLEEMGTSGEMEPVIHPINQISRSQFRDRKVHSHVAEIRNLQVNRKEKVALVELALTRDVYDFARCYISQKASFVLGDVRFSNRVRTVLGASVRISPLLAQRQNQRAIFEPLTDNLCSKLSVSSNAQIPLHLHLNEIKLIGGYEAAASTRRRSRSKEKTPIEGEDSSSSKKDLLISANALPPHMDWTLRRLDLIPHEEYEAIQEEQQ